MRLILHIGLHKTASTAFQTLCRDNAAALGASGVFWRVHDGYPAHHDEAWSLLRGEAGAISDYVAEARAAGAQTAILSSEELDYVLHVPQKALAMEAEARDAGVTDVIWAAALRRPSEAFRSHISELTKHGIHLDPLQGYLEIMRSGGLHFTGRHNGGAQFWNWYFTFDYDRYVTRLRDTVPGQVLAYDYHGGASASGGAGSSCGGTGGPGAAGCADGARSRQCAAAGKRAITANLASILRAHGHVEAEIATVIGGRAPWRWRRAESDRRRRRHRRGARRPFRRLRPSAGLWCGRKARAGGGLTMAVAASETYAGPTWLQRNRMIRDADPVPAARPPVLRSLRHHPDLPILQHLALSLGRAGGSDLYRPCQLPRASDRPELRDLALEQREVAGALPAGDPAGASGSRCS